MKKLLVFSICANVVLVWAIVMIWNSHRDIIKSIEVSWDSREGLFPRQFNEEEKRRIEELRPAIEGFCKQVNRRAPESIHASAGNDFFARFVRAQKQSVGFRLTN